MEKVTDWLLLWQQLVTAQDRFWNLGKEKKKENKDFWKGRAQHFDKMVQKRWATPDASREFIVSSLKAHRNATVLDIGAGTGAWTLLMAKHAARVTAIEPSNAMCAVMEEKLAVENITNVTIVQGNWPNMTIDPHDFSFASHSMYGVADLKAFVEAMAQITRKTCFLLMRVLFANSVMAKAATHIWGQPYDSPNFQVAYNALMQMDIYPNVVMEAAGGWEPWRHDTINDAMGEVKKRFGIESDSAHDAFLIALLETSLREENDEYVWPVGNRSGIVYWDA